MFKNIFSVLNWFLLEINLEKFVQIKLLIIFFFLLYYYNISTLNLYVELITTLKNIYLHGWIVSPCISYNIFRVIIRITVSAHAYKWGGTGTTKKCCLEYQKRKGSKLVVECLSSIIWKCYRIFFYLKLYITQLKEDYIY